jgi:hypothetical protein
MANYAILRVQKLKSTTSVRRSFKHSYREQDTPNADPDMLDENQLFDAKNTAEAMQKFRDRLPEKIRKNGVLCVEHLVTASPEWFEGKTKGEQNQYFEDSLEFLKVKWGKDNVICGGVHRDEKTPHMFAYVVPIDEQTGNLNCRKWLGDKDALSQLQDSFIEAVGTKNKIDRGVKGSKAKHKTIKKYYSELADLERLESYNPPSKSDFLKAGMGVKVANIDKLTDGARLTASSSQRIKELSTENDSIKKTLKYMNEKIKPTLHKDRIYKHVYEQNISLKAENSSISKELKNKDQAIKSLLKKLDKDQER